MNRTNTAAGESYFHGWLYRTVIDPALVPIRNRVKRWIPEGSSVVDIGCGTGAQLFAMGNHIARGLGVDLSETQIEHARRQATQRGLPHIDFQVADAARLYRIKEGEFDIAVTSLVIHEMPQQMRVPVLREMRRISRQMIVVDWEARQCTLWRRISTDFIERLAGREHYRGYRSFTKAGGIPELLKEAGLNVTEEQETSKGTMRLWLCE